MKYLCSVCKKNVQVKDGKIIRECEHINAAVIAELKAHAQGFGKI